MTCVSVFCDIDLKFFCMNLTFDQRTYFLSKAYFDWGQEVGNVEGGESYIEECPP